MQYCLTAWRISAESAQPLWQAEPWMTPHHYTPGVIHGGRVYAHVHPSAEVTKAANLEANGRQGKHYGIVCLDARDGRTITRVPWMTNMMSNTPLVAAEGMLIGTQPLSYGPTKVGLTFWDIRDPHRLVLLGEWNNGLAQGTTPLLLQGRLYQREQNHIVCYDLRRP